MTISNSNIRTFPTGDGVVTTFTYTSKITSKGELWVYVDGVRKALGADYDVTNVGEEIGGSVIFKVAPAAGAKVLFERHTERKQEVHFGNNGSTFSAEVFERIEDKNTAIAQEHDDLLYRTVKVAADSQRAGPTLPEPETGKVLKWDASGNLVNTTSDVDAAIASVNANAQALANTVANAAVAAAQTSLNNITTQVTNSLDAVKAIEESVNDSLASITTSEANIATKEASVQSLYNNAITNKNEIAALKQEAVNASLTATSAAQAAEGLVDAVGNPVKYYFKQRLLNIW